MADVKISGLPASTVPLAGTEVLPIVQGGATKQVSIANVTAGRAIAATSITTDTYKAASSSGGALQNSSGTPQLQWGAGGGNNLSVDVAININPANAAVAISPTGTGTLTINPATASTMNNVAIGGTTPLAGAFTTATANSFIPNSATIPTNGVYLPAANSVGIATNSANAIYINSSQQVGVGTSAPAQPFVVSKNQNGSTWTQISNTTAGSGSAVGVLLSTDSAVQATLELDSLSNNNFASAAGMLRLRNIGAYPIGFFTNETQRMLIASDGIITMNAYGAGAATFSASGVISSVSDETWKTKDGVPNNPDAMLQKLEPGYWFYNEEKAPIFGADRQLGFYAQNVNEAIGNEAAPTPEEGKPWGYYDRSVLAVAVMSLKNALSTIEELKQRIATLENK